MDQPELGTQERDAAEGPPEGPVMSSLAALASAVREVGPSARRVRPASFAPRFWAAFVDVAVVTLLSLLFFVFAAVAEAIIGLDEYAGVYFATAYLVLVLMYWGTEAYGSATPGKSIVGLRVVRHDGRPATRGRRVGRWAVKQSPLICFAGALSLLPLSERGLPVVDWFPFAFALLSQVLGLVVTVGCLLVLTPSRRALHDLLSGTAVLKEEDVVRDAGYAFRPLPLRVAEAVTASARALDGRVPS